MNKKILYLIAGAAVIILGILTMIDEDIALILCSLMFFIYGFADLLRWTEGRKSGTSSMWTLIGALFSIILGASIFIGNISAIRFSISFMGVILSLWLVVSGVFEILGAIMYRRAMKSADLGIQAPGSMTSIVSGGIMIGVGLLALIVPVFALYTVHLWLSAGLIIAGVRLIAEARAVGELEENT